MKKIALFSTDSKSLANFRYDLVKSFIKNGNKVAVYCPRDKDFSNTQKKFEEINVSTNEIKISNTSLNFFLDLIFIIRQILELRKHDVVLLFRIKAVLYCSLASRILKSNNCFSFITGLGYVFSSNSSKAKILRKIILPLYKVALKKNKKIFFQNIDDLNFFVENKISTPHQAVLINGSGVDTDYYSYKSPKKKLSFLFIGRLIKDKGIGEYIEAAIALKKKYPEVIFKILGGHHDNPTAISKQEFDFMVKNLDFLGETLDVRPYIESSSVFVLPSYREGTSRAALECMSIGRPIITTDAPGCREVVVENQNGFLVPIKNVERLKIAMEKFINNPDLIKLMGDESRKIALERYCVHKVNNVILSSILNNGE